MAKEVTAYMAHNGQLYRSREDAEFSDFSSELRDDIDDFLKQRQASAQDTPVLQRLLRDWELWKRGPTHDMRMAPPIQTATSTEGTVAALQRAIRDYRAADDTPNQPPAKQLRLPLPAPAPRPKATIPPKRSEPPAASPYRKRVLVYGLPERDHAAIQKAFGDAFHLTLHDGSHPPTISALKQCHKIIVMVQFVGFSEMAKMHAKGHEPMSIIGGAEELDTTLTAMYVHSQ